MQNNLPTIKADVIVIGAGIQGAGVAQACALQGWKVHVLERNSEPGLETSSASSKLIHGGLRYLETLQIKLVYECLRERKYLLKNAPHLVHLTPFYIPIYQTSSRKSWWVYIGLSVYALLGLLHPNCRFRVVPKEQWPALGLKQQGLLRVYQYFDAQTDDNRLTRSVLESAQSLGAELHFNTEVDNAVYSNSSGGDDPDGDHSAGYTVETASGFIQAPCLINAAGPWVNRCAKSIANAPPHPIDWVQGVHIVLPRSCEACFYVESVSDNRPMFFLPWKGKTLVGTTEKVLNSEVAEASETEINYLLNSYNEYFPDKPVTRGEVETVLAGVRVLPLVKGKSANKRNRETVFAKHASKGCLYLGVYGGKLTSYRAMAEKVVASIAPVLGMVGTPKSTRLVPLPAATREP